MDRSVARRVVLGTSGLGMTTLVLPHAASAASFDGTTLSASGPDQLAVSTADAGDGTHDVVLTVTLTDSGGDPYTEAVRVDMTVGDDQGDPTGTTVDGEATGEAVALSTTGTVTFAVAFPTYGDHQFTVATTPAAASHPSGITLLYTHTGLPGAPTAVSGTPGDTEIALTWTAPGDTGGTTLTDHETRYSSDGGSSWSTWTSTGSTTAAATVTGLTNGTGYVLQVRAVNANGAGDPSTATGTLTPRTTPGAPTITSISAGDAELSVTFTAGSDGGESIDNYEYELDASGTWTALDPADATSPVTITGLTNGTTYAVRIRAVNAAGSGAESNSVDGTPTSGLPSQLAALGTALSGYTSATSVSTVVSAIEGQGFTVIAIPIDGDIAESLAGASGTLSAEGTFSLTAFQATDTLATSAGFATSALNGHPYLGFVLFDASGYRGAAVKLFRTLSSSTRLRDLFYPNTARSIYWYARNGDGTTASSTNASTSWQFSNESSIGTAGYYTTSQFSRDDGVWGIRNGSALDAGSGGVSLAAETGNYGAGNFNSSDASARAYWNGSTLTSWRMLVFIRT